MPPFVSLSGSTPLRVLVTLATSAARTAAASTPLPHGASATPSASGSASAVCTPLSNDLVVAS